MSKTGDTKKRIYDMLKTKNSTLTDISNKLDLAPSTVSQHLNEMLDAGMIVSVNDRPRKWKYYGINQNYNTAAAQNPFNFRRFAVPMAVIAILLVGGFVFLISGTLTTQASAQQVYLTPGASVPSGSTVFSVSDSPTFYNISALVVTVNNASIHSETTGKWYKIPLQASSFDLVKLRNISTIMSGVELSNGIYNYLVLNISSVTATVNGTSEHVILPTGRLVLLTDFNITSNATNWINIDFDLEHSLHILNNGTIVMMPVINIRHVNDNNIELNQSYIITASGPGQIRGFNEYGMDANGSMRANFSIPQNTSISTNVKGRFAIFGNGVAPIIIRTARGIIMGGNANVWINSSAGAGVPTGTSSGTAAIINGNCTTKYMNGTTPNTTSIQVGNATAITTRVGGFGPGPVRCCSTVLASNSTNSSARIVRCMGFGRFAYPPNITVNALNSGIYIRRPINGNWTMVNVSVNGTHGNFGGDCSYQNGAMTCDFNSSATPAIIAVGRTGFGLGGGRVVGPVIVATNGSANATGNVIVHINPGGPIIGIGRRI